MTVFQAAAAAVATVLGGGGLVAFLWAVGKVKGIETSLGVLRDANAGLEDAYRQLEQRQEAERVKCAADLAELSGRVAVLTGEFGKQIAKSIVDAIKETP